MRNSTRLKCAQKNIEGRQRCIVLSVQAFKNCIWEINWRSFCAFGRKKRHDFSDKSVYTLILGVSANPALCVKYTGKGSPGEITSCQISWNLHYVARFFLKIFIQNVTEQ